MKKKITLQFKLYLRFSAQRFTRCHLYDILHRFLTFFRKTLKSPLKCFALKISISESAKSVLNTPKNIAVNLLFIQFEFISHFHISICLSRICVQKFAYAMILSHCHCNTVPTRKHSCYKYSLIFSIILYVVHSHFYN